MDTLKQIDKFELIDHGIEHSQYFQGCGVACTNFSNVVTGIGSNPAEAIDDCLEQIAMIDFNVEGMETRIMAQEGWEALSTTPDVQTIYSDSEDDPEDDPEDVYYHVSIRWNEKAIRNVRFYNIIWDADANDGEPDLPADVTLEINHDVDLKYEGANVLSDEFDWCVQSYDYDILVN